ncbi:glycosyltransferase family 4 protein [Desulforhabdus amnigena]|uniref:Glycosyl transferase n=1 Tax=Desulforhabdus amnigena TaxID=40218 RepID=A0A9W6D3I8_9BACT|nr:glycosyltransferase family 4 protein [Desulforhabdus amnigena]NLJ29816.1 glycosyltransferase family 4 protein [Deltaproteobacteria bacterium]GLI33908.1 glycosyl transferase [Desulforhabdus amnigena]
MKIAFYCPNKPLAHPHPSGDLIIAQGISRELNRAGHTCKEIAAFRSRWFWKTSRGWREALIALRAAYRAAHDFHPHIWLTYHSYYKSPDVLGPAISRLMGIPYVLFQPMYATKWRKDPETRIGFYLNRLAIKASHHAFTNNLNDLEALGRILPPRRITHLPPGIFPEDFQHDDEAGKAVRLHYGISPDTPLILTAARFRNDVKFESLVYLFKSLALLGRFRKDFVCLVAGDGPMEEALRRMADALLPGRVIFAGRIPRHELFRFYSAADLFVFPGIGESLGMVFLEAQACALPVVALKTGGIAQVVKQNRTGILVPEDGGEAMARTIDQLLRDPEHLKALAANGPRFIRNERNLRWNYLELARQLEKIRTIAL